MPKSNPHWIFNSKKLQYSAQYVPLYWSPKGAPYVWVC